MYALEDKHIGAESVDEHGIGTNTISNTKERQLRRSYFSPIDEGVVYFYRPSRFVGGGVSFDIKEGDKVITTMYNNGYYTHQATEGEHTYTVESIY